MLRTPPGAARCRGCRRIPLGVARGGQGCAVAPVCALPGAAGRRPPRRAVRARATPPAL